MTKTKPAAVDYTTISYRACTKCGTGAVAWDRAEQPPEPYCLQCGYRPLPFDRALPRAEEETARVRRMSHGIAL